MWTTAKRFRYDLDTFLAYQIRRRINKIKVWFSIYYKALYPPLWEPQILYKCHVNEWNFLRKGKVKKVKHSLFPSSFINLHILHYICHHPLFFLAYFFYFFASYFPSSPSRLTPPHSCVRNDLLTWTRTCTILRWGSEVTGWGYQLRPVGKLWDLLYRYIKCISIHNFASFVTVLSPVFRLCIHPRQPVSLIDRVFV